MGLHESYAQIRGQVLLMDPIPSINQVFALVSQEENQRKISIMNDPSGTTESMAFYAQEDTKRITHTDARKTLTHQYGRPQKKERPLCSYCGYSRHDVNKCYKLCGYPPGYKPKQKAGINIQNNSGNQANCEIVNQIFEPVDVINQAPTSDGDIGRFVQTLNPVQYQQLMNVLNTHLRAAKLNSEISVNFGANSGKASGTCFSISIHPTFNSPRHWVVDSGAMIHICPD